MTAFSPGETVVLQEIWLGQVWAARPMRVVQDGSDLVALWFPRGTRWKAPTSDPVRPWNSDRAERLAECAAREAWVFRDSEWDVDTLWLMRPGDWHALWVSWLPSGQHWGWYVDLQEPFRRTGLGFKTMDLMLDLIVDPGRAWRWKDEDELATFVERGVLPEWRPDPRWEKPELPEGWERLWR